MITVQSQNNNSPFKTTNFSKCFDDFGLIRMDIAIPKFHFLIMTSFRGHPR